MKYRHVDIALIILLFLFSVNAVVVLMATNVDGVYDDDPRRFCEVISLKPPPRYIHHAPAPSSFVLALVLSYRSPYDAPPSTPNTMAGLASSLAPIMVFTFRSATMF